MTDCKHPHGGMVNGAWLCGKCYRYLPDRPQTLRMVENPTSLGGDGGVRVSKYRQVVDKCPESPATGGMTLHEFVMSMASRFVARTKGSLPFLEAVSLSVDVLAGIGEEFGNEDMDWGRDGAIELVYEEMCCWDDDSGGRNSA